MIYKYSLRWLLFALFVSLSAHGAAEAQTLQGWKWRFDAKSVVNYGLMPTPGVVYAMNENGLLHALDAATGRELWRYRARPRRYVSISERIGNQLIVIERNDYNGSEAASAAGQPATASLIAFDALTGRERWRRELADDNSSNGIGDQTAVYIGVGEASVASIEAATGKTRWQSDFCPDAPQLLAVEANVLYAECHGKLHALDAASGAARWQFGRRGEISPQIVFTPDSLVFTTENANDKRSVFAVDKQTGAQRWRTALPERGDYFFQTRAESVVAVTPLNTGRMVAVDLAGGKLLWRYESPDAVNGSTLLNNDLERVRLRSPAVAGNVFYSGSDDGSLHALDARTGRELWQRRLSDEPLESPVIVDQTGYVLIVKNNEHYLAAVNLATGALAWQMRLYANSRALLASDKQLFFATGDNRVNAVDPAAVTRLAQTRRTLGAPLAVKQTVNSAYDTPVISLSGPGRNGGDFADVGAAVEGGKVYAAATRSGRSSLHEIDLRSGAKRLIAEFAGTQFNQLTVGGGAAYLNGRDTRGGGYRLTSVDLGNGKTLWEASGAGYLTTRPKRAGEYVYFTTNDRVLRVFNRAGETVLELKNISGSGVGAPAVVAGETIYATVNNNELVARDLRLGQIRWTKELPGIVGLTANAELLFASSTDENLYAFDLASGDLVWRLDTEGTPAYSDDSLIVAGDQVFYPSSVGYAALLQAVNARTGKINWQRTVSSHTGFVSTDRFVLSRDFNRIFDRTSGKSRSPAAALGYTAALDAAAENVLLVKNQSSETSAVQLAAVDLANNNKILWQIEF